MMIVADVLAPWTEMRKPQFLTDVADGVPWRDVVGQPSERIPPTPGLCVWRLWCDAAQLATIEGLPAYEVLRSGEVDGPHCDPVDWPVRAARAGASDAAFEALPDAGWLELGAIYLYEGVAYIVRQAHNRTEHPPADVPALFMVHRMDATSLLEWVAGEQVYVGTQRTYGGKIYECLQAHVTQVDWTPPAVGALWSEIVETPPTGEWAAGVAYKVNDQVTYNGQTYICLQAHTSISTWYPSVVPALWKLL